LSSFDTAVAAAYPLRMPKATLNVSLTPELMSYVAGCVALGQYRSASEVLRAGLRLLQREEGISSPTQATHLPAKESSRPNQRSGGGS
jgi:antitoxin ParD1/3/4